jgi:CubicO group peptidase (beta-lactamase class C family)
MTEPSARAPASRPRGAFPLHLILLAALLAAPPLGACGQEAGTRAAAVEEGLSTLVQIQGREPAWFSITDRLAHYRVPGVSVAFIEGGRIDWAKGYGVADVETGTPVTVQTLFQAASISKPVAAMAALRLVDEGALELDAPVNRYLTGWSIPENEFTARHPVTLRHLLTHTGGLTVHGFPGYAVTDPVPDVVGVLDGGFQSNTPAIRADTFPGSLWRYSGGGYTVMQKLLEDVTGQDFPVLMRELVLDPVDMTLSSYEQPLPPDRERQAASGHLEDGRRVEGAWQVYPEMAAAGLWTNPTELARLALEVQASLRGESNRILSQAMTREMLTPGMGSWGLGFGIQEEGPTRFSHGGSNHGFKAAFQAFVDEGRGVMVMTNGDRGSLLAQEIIYAVQRVYGWPVPGPREVEVANLAPKMLSRLAGRWEVAGATLSGEALVAVIAVEGDHLRVELDDGTVSRYFPLSDTEFIDLETAETLRALVADDGVVAELVLGREVRAARIEG